MSRMYISDDVNITKKLQIPSAMGAMYGHFFTGLKLAVADVGSGMRGSATAASNITSMGPQVPNPTPGGKIHKKISLLMDQGDTLWQYLEPYTIMFYLHHHSKEIQRDSREASQHLGEPEPC